MPSSEARKRKRAELAITKEAELAAIQERAEKKRKALSEAEQAESADTKPEAPPKKKKSKKNTSDPATTNTEADTSAGADADTPSANPNKAPLKNSRVPGTGDDSAAPKHRFLLFLGNLPLMDKAKLEAALQTHLAPTAPASIRIPTPKDAPTKTKGYAFVEFATYDRMQLCLTKFHHVMFEGRRMNVELTAGGGGNTKERREKINERNAKLEEERRRRKEKEEEEKRSGKKGKVEEAKGEGALAEMHPSRRGRMI